MNFNRNQQNAAHYSIDFGNVNIIDRENWHFRQNFESGFADFNASGPPKSLQTTKCQGFSVQLGKRDLVQARLNLSADSLFGGSRKTYQARPGYAAAEMNF